MGHLLGGDFNHPSWQAGFEEWAGTHDIWTLTDPALKAYASGNSLDKFLYVPGGEVPGTFLMEQTHHQEDNNEDFYYPGETGTTECVGNHHPIFINIPVRKERKPRFIRRIVTHKVDEEEWETKALQAQLKIKGKEEVHQQLYRMDNTTKLLTSLKAILEGVIGDLFARKPPEDAIQKNIMKDPFEQLKKRNSKHPLLPQLRIAHIAGQREKERMLLNRIQRDGWQDFLASIKASNVTKIYKMIRKWDGREDRVFVYPCAAPIIENGIYYGQPQAKSERIAEFFELRLKGRRIATNSSYPDWWKHQARTLKRDCKGSLPHEDTRERTSLPSEMLR